MANRTLNFKAGNKNKRKVLIGLQHTFHWLHWHTSCSLVGKNGWKAVGNYAIWVWVFCQRTLEGTHGVLGSIFWEHIIWTICAHQPLMFVWDFEVDAWSKFWRWNLIKIYVWTRDMTKTSYFGKLNSTLRFVVPLAMFTDIISAFNQILEKEVWSYKITFSLWEGNMSA